MSLKVPEHFHCMRCGRVISYRGFCSECEKLLASKGVGVVKQFLAEKGSLNSVEKPKLSLWQRLVLRVNGCVFLRYEGKPRFLRPTEIYLVKCKIHGYYEDYKQGYDETFCCPNCFERTG